MRSDIDYEYELSSALGKVLLIENEKIWNEEEFTFINEHYNEIIFVIKALKAEGRSVWLDALELNTSRALDQPNSLFQFIWWVRQAMQLIKDSAASHYFAHIIEKDDTNTVKSFSSAFYMDKPAKELIKLVIKWVYNMKLITLNASVAAEDDIFIENMATMMLKRVGEEKVSYWYHKSVQNWEWPRELEAYAKEYVVPEVKMMEEYRDD